MSTACFPCNQVDSWQQLNYHTLLATHSPLSEYKKLEKLEIILKICNLKKGIGIEGEKTMQICKQIRNQIAWKQVEDTAQGLLHNRN